MKIDYLGMSAVITALASLVTAWRGEAAKKRRRRRRRSTAAPSAPASTSTAPPTEPGSARFATAWRAALALVFAAGSIANVSAAGALAPPVAAHHAIVDGTTSCAPDGSQLVTWSIGNSQPRQAMTLARVSVGDQDGAPWPVSGYQSPVAPSEATSATTTSPGALAGALRLAVVARWPDGHRSAVLSPWVPLPGVCEAPPTSTSTTSAPTTTIAQPNPRTTAPTSAPATSSSTSTSRSSPGSHTSSSLPSTGGNARAWAIGGASVLLIGLSLVMVFCRRRHP